MAKLNRKTRKNLLISRKRYTFATLLEKKATQVLDYGVMVAQQVLVLFVQVRILVVQPHFKIHSPSEEDTSWWRVLFIFIPKSSHIPARAYLCPRPCLPVPPSTLTHIPVRRRWYLRPKALTYGHKKRAPLSPTFVNLKSNTMKNTLQMYGLLLNLQIIQRKISVL